LPQTEVVGCQIVFQFLDAFLHIGPLVVFSPEFRRRACAGGNQQAEGVAGDLQQAASRGTLLLSQPLSYYHKSRRFRSPVLLSCHGHHRVFLGGYLTNEDATNLYQAQKDRNGREDVAERQPSFGQTCLHRWSFDLAAKLQRTVSPEEVVMASQQLQMVVQSLRSATCRTLPGDVGGGDSQCGCG